MWRQMLVAIRGRKILSQDTYQPEPLLQKGIICAYMAIFGTEIDSFDLFFNHQKHRQCIFNIPLFLMEY